MLLIDNYSKVLADFISKNGSEIHSAVKNIPLYDKLNSYYESGSATQAFNFHNWPFTNKDDITDNFPFNFEQENFWDRLNAGELEVVESSGTSENRIQIIRSADFRDVWTPVLRKYHKVYRDDPECKEALLTTLNCSRSQCNLAVATYEERINGNRLVLNRSKSPALWTDGECERILVELEQYKPSVMTVHPIYLVYLDLWCEKNNIIPPKIETVFFSYDYPSQLYYQRARRWSKTDVYNAYGLTEAFTVGMTCEHGHLHALPEACLVEIIKDGQPVQEGELGEIVITSLRNMMMPIIRYRSGDVAQLKSYNQKCECGKESMILDNIHGRIRELTMNKQGALITLHTVDSMISTIGGIVSYQINQPSIGEIAISLLVATGQFDKAREDELRMKLFDLYGCTTLKISYVEEITPTYSGKYLLVKDSFLRNEVDVLNKYEFDSLNYCKSSDL